MTTTSEQPVSAPAASGVIVAARGLALGGVVFGTVLLSGMLGWEWGWIISDVVYLVVALGAGLAVTIAAVNSEGQARLAWAMVGAGILLEALGDTAWVLHGLFLETEVPFPGPPDLLYLLGYPLMAVGLLLIPRRHESGFRRAGMVLDGAISAVAVALIGWHFLLQPLWQTAQGVALWELAVGLAYPVGDLVLVAAAVVLATSYERTDRVMTPFATGFAFFVAADVVYVIQEWFEGYVSGSWVDGLWLVAYGMFALGGARLLQASNGPGRLRRGNKANDWVAFVLVALVAGSLLLAIVWEWPREPSTVLVIGALALAMGFIGRLWVALGEGREAINFERGQLVSVVSHELRTPITGITGFLALLDEGWDGIDDLTKREMVSLALSEANRLSRIVTDLVQISRGNLHGSDLALQPLDAASVVEGVVLATPLLKEGSVRVEVPPGLIVRADRQRLVQIVSNLLTNAERYGGPNVLIAGLRQGVYVQIEVHDDGPGVAAGHESTIWERFERGEHRFNASKPGSGLGLALVHSLVEAHGGTVGYRPSERLGGACFWFRLPAGGDQPRAANDSA